MNGRTALGFTLGSAAVLAAVAFLVWASVREPAPEVAPEPEAWPIPFNDATVRSNCSGCHAFPEPDILPRDAWWKVIHRMTKMPGYPDEVLPIDSLSAWYVARAPERLELPPEPVVPEARPLQWKRRSFPATYATGFPFIANLLPIDLDGDDRLELVATDMSRGLVLLGRPYADDLSFEILEYVPNPAHVRPVDLDRDGAEDLIVANLGSLPPMDHDLGSVDWLRRNEAGQFERHILLEGLGRVADVRSADFDGDGDWDLAMGEFGYRRTGQVGVLEHLPDDQFTLHQLDGRHGSIHTAITDLNGDGRPDILALLAQEFEMVVAYVNEGDFTFTTTEVHKAPHPAWGSSGMQLVDLDGDEDVDIVMTNGDMFDDPSLKPYHGVRWLEQVAPLEFAVHDLVRMYGAHRAHAADLDGDGDLDIVACSFMPKTVLDDATGNGLDLNSMMWLEQTEPGTFVAHSLELNLPRHATLTVTDFDGDGDADLAVGNAFFDVGDAPDSVVAVELWENLGRR